MAEFAFTLPVFLFFFFLMLSFLALSIQQDIVNHQALLMLRSATVDASKTPGTPVSVRYAKPFSFPFLPPGITISRTLHGQSLN